MDLSSATLKKLQNLAFSVEGSTQKSVDISSTLGMQSVLKVAAAETTDQNIIIRYNDFLSTVTESEKAALELYKLTNSSVAEKSQAILSTVTVTPNKVEISPPAELTQPQVRKIKGMYRGQPIYK